MTTFLAPIALAVLGRGPAIDAACEYTDDYSVSTTQGEPAQHLTSPMPWKAFTVRACAWLLLMLGTTAAWAENYSVAFRDFCFVQEGSCTNPNFSPSQLTINVGDTVSFYELAYDYLDVHNVVADDGSFRCAVGCDGEGGDGTPVTDVICDATGPPCIITDAFRFSRTFNVPGVIRYHDEVSKAAGVIIVKTFEIGAGITGSWFDPGQSGHGLMIEVLPDNRLLAGWLTFNPAGTQQAWLVGIGTYSGNTATVTKVEQPTGGRWIPNFDANQIVHNDWGALTFTFTSCNHGRVDFNSVLGYGTGSMNLTRLTQPAGSTCSP